jgi:uncharacterized repeat protein (TIGR01451 family)
MKARYTFISFVLGLGLALGLLWCLENPSAAASRIEPTLELRVCPSGCDYTSVQAAVDAANDGDVIKVATGTYTGVTARAGVTQVVYISKTVTIQGGYTITDWNISNPVFYPTTLDAQGQGRVFYVTGDISPTIEGLRITDGTTRSSGGYDTGGGVYAISATVMLANSSVFNNDAYYGGGIGVINATITIINSQVFSNTAHGSGGGIYVVNAVEDDGNGTNAISITVVIMGSQVLSNTAEMHGGGMHIVNEVEPYMSPDHIGSVTALISHNLVSSNATRQSSGGGICLFHSAATLTDNIITANTAAYGGGLHSSRSWYWLPLKALVFTGNTVSQNRSEGNGGGLYLEWHSAILNSNLIVSNTAAAGGGLYSLFGGGTFTNTIITDNRVDHTGSGLHLVASHLRSSHTTIGRNYGGDGSGIYFAPSMGSVVAPNIISLTNTIITSQTVGITGTTFLPSKNKIALDGVLWFGNEANTGGIWPITISHAYTGDPAFAADGYHLTAGSAAIDKGVSVGVFTDIDGEPRPPNEGSDLGADEFPAALVVTKQANPTTVEGGEQLTYTIRITNTGSGDLHAIITDTLPDHIASGHTSGGTAVVPGGQITWTDVITAPRGVWVETVVVTVASDYTGPLPNLVEVTTEEGAIGKAQVVVNLFRVYLPLVMRDYYVRCETHTAALTLSATATTLQVSDTATVTATLMNQGCVALGLPQYRLLIQSDQIDPIFDPDSPEPVVHYLAVAPGQSDAVDFVLQAITPGQATLDSSASFEVHLGYPGPAYWGIVWAAPLVINVTP